MSVQTSFDGFVEDLAAQLAGYGFEQGEGGLVFRRFSPDGDALIVEVQISEHSSRHEKVFYLNVALVLAPKWGWDRQRNGRSESALPWHENGIWRRRLGFTRLSPAGGQWRIADDDTAYEASTLVRQRLDETMPRILPLLNRAVVLDQTVEVLGPGDWLLRAWLLAEWGPIEELRHLLFVERPQSTYHSIPTKAVWGYANSRAQPAEWQ
ncbi:DUF4304 domain-containing protein [Micromonospora yangpuensis]|uniref:DUF4304 domain-containing protein n=1 Tax=Micromonospora yangpuensis TaxID=683228 RepID=A0A1C6UX24_9ACTN|nr:DUF4304 domain-containing protein [Micromonospora yangpuensis]GGL94003.1 hypothetical protein GCM10012279_09480 [Micromonospora yangpuensis]SCL58560.1 protein of unknown function [Micromonospora yangpuensis]